MIHQSEYNKIHDSNVVKKIGINKFRIRGEIKIKSYERNQIHCELLLDNTDRKTMERLKKYIEMNNPNSEEKPQLNGNTENSPLVKSLMESSNRSKIVEDFLKDDNLYESTGPE